MLLAETEQFRYAGHRTVIVHDLTDDGCRFERGLDHQIDGTFSLSGPNQDSALAGAQRKHMAGTSKVVGSGVADRRC